VLIGVLTAAFGSMAVKAVLERRSGAPLDRHPDRHSFLVGGFLARWFYWAAGPVERAAIRLGLGPFFFNLAGLGSGLLAGLLFALGRTTLAGWTIALGGVSDIFDGWIARTTGVADRRGAFIDSTLDRFSETATLVGLCWLFASSPAALTAAAAALGGALLVSYTRARGEALGVLCRKGVLQRTERVLLLWIGAVLDATVSDSLSRGPGALLVPIVSVMAVGTLATAAYRTVWIARRLPVSGG